VRTYAHAETPSADRTCKIAMLWPPNRELRRAYAQHIRILRCTYVQTFIHTCKAKTNEMAGYPLGSLAVS